MTVRSAGSERSRRQPNASAAAPRLPGLAALQPQDVVLDLLGWYLLPVGRRAWSGGLVRLLGDLGFSTAAARIALGRLVRRGLLEPAREGRLVYYLPTPRLATVLAEGERRIRGFGREESWDGLWTVLWYAIPEDHKAEGRRLAHRLRFLGFGSPQEGMWVAPRERGEDVRTLVEELDLGPHVAVIVGRTAGVTDVGRLVERLWDLDDAALRYEAFIEAFAPFGERRAARSLSEREAFLIRTRALAAYRRFTAMDPALPEELMGRAWRRAQVVETFHRVDEELRSPSARYFDAANTPQRRPARASG